MVVQVVLGYVVGVLAALATLHPRRWGMVGAVAVLAYAVWVLAGQPGSREGYMNVSSEYLNLTNEKEVEDLPEEVEVAVANRKGVDRLMEERPASKKESKKLESGRRFN